RRDGANGLGDDADFHPLHKEADMSGTSCSLLLAALLAPAVLPGQSGQFVVRLGRDTLAIEQYKRTADRLYGEQVIRSPRTVHRIYTVRFGPGGAAQRFALATHEVAAAPAPAETKATVTFEGDSAMATVPSGDSTLVVRARVGQ